MLARAVILDAYVYGNMQKIQNMQNMQNMQNIQSTKNVQEKKNAKYAKLDLPNQTKPKSKLLVKAVNTWVRSAFDIV